MAGVREGDTLVFEARVSRVSDDGDYITVEVPGHGTPVTIPAISLDGDDIEHIPLRRR